MSRLLPTFECAFRRLVRRVLSSPLTLLVLLWLIAKYTLYLKIGDGYLTFFYPENDFFPSFIAAVNPIFLDAATIVAILVGKRWGYVVGLFINLALIVHPFSFGTQHYVMSCYMFLWLSLKGTDGSVFFGRVTLSFLYMAATIGKLTPGWISGEHYEEFLHHLRQHPLFIILGELLFGVAFLFPFYFGVFVPIAIVVGMIYSISWLIFDAVGPILGMLLTFVIFRESRSTSIKLILPERSRFSRVIERSSRYLNLPCIATETSADISVVTIRSIDGVVSQKQGVCAWEEVLRRIPVFALIPAFFSLRTWRRWMEY